MPDSRLLQFHQICTCLPVNNVFLNTWRQNKAVSAQAKFWVPQEKGSLNDANKRRSEVKSSLTVS